MKTSFGLKLSWITALVAATVMAGSACIRAADQPIRVLIFSGQNNHDWKTTTPKLKAILADSERFMVDVTDHPEHSTAENLANYDLFLSDWNAWGDAKVKDWPTTAQLGQEGYGIAGNNPISIRVTGGTGPTTCFFTYAQAAANAAPVISAVTTTGC